MNRKTMFTRAALAIVYLILMEIFLKPVLSPKSFTFILILVTTAAFLPIPDILDIIFNKENDYNKSETLKIGTYTTIGIFAFLMLFYIFIGGLKLPFTGRKADFHNLLEYETSTDFQENFDEQKQDKVILLAKNEALRVANSLVPSGGLYQIDKSQGTLNQVEENGETNFYWVFPLEHGKLMRFLGTNLMPGFIKVDATKEESAEFVEQDIKYIPNEIFGQSLERKLRTSGGDRSKFYTDYSFEIDSEGMGQWVATKYIYKYGVAVKEVEGVVVLDPLTGKTESYKVGDEPDWVDRVYPESVFENRVQKWAENDLPLLQGGTRAISTKNFYIKDNKLQFYAEITSSGNDTKLLGFMLYSPKDGTANFFTMDGKVSSLVYKDMNGGIDKSQYSPEKLRLVNVANIPTYFSKVKDEEAIVGYAYASIIQGEKAIGWSKKVGEARTNYLNSYFSSTSETKVNPTLENKKLTGIVSRVGSNTGGTFIFKIEGNSTLFKISSTKSPIISLTQPGDSVTIEFYEESSSSALKNVIDFKNNSVK